MSAKKTLTHKSLLGQQGANLIERIVSDMGQVWRPTAVHDTGIDGTIEFRDPATGEVTNTHIQVQSKATSAAWESENDDRFVYRVREEDLAYWLRGNLQVILVVSRPSSEEAYWISVKEYFKDTQRRASRKVEFSKAANRFDKSCLSRLSSIATHTQAGIYKPPIRKEEELVSNLLQVRSCPKVLYVGEIPFRARKELNDWMNARDIHGRREWIIKNERIFSFHDLREYPWTEIVDRGTVEDFETREWSDSVDPDKLREWVELLNACLRGRLSRDGVRFQSEPGLKLYYFSARSDGRPREFRYQSQQKQSGREVVKTISNKKTGEVMCYRHSAMEGRFLRFDGLWYLEVNPTYYYSKDDAQYRFHGDQLAGIKRLERNESVLGQLIMWERLLTDRGDMFRPEYSMLRFDGLMRCTVELGIEDDLWLPVEGGAEPDEEEFNPNGSLL